MSFQPAAPDTVDTALIDRVDQRTITKRDGTNAMIYEVYVVGFDQPLSTFKRTIAESAHSLVGQPAEIHYQAKRNGEFTNYYLNQILPPPSNPVERAQRAAEAPPLLSQAAGLSQPSQPSQGLTTPSSGINDKDRSIHRQTAAKVAATLFAAQPSDAPTFWENVQRLTEYFDTGQIPGQNLVAEGLDDDIPF